MESVIKIKKGLNYPLKGEAEQRLVRSYSDYYAISPKDFTFLTPSLKVKVGDNVQIGTPLFSSKIDETVHFVAPVSGEIVEIRRGEKRAIEAIIIKKDATQNSVKIQIPDEQTRENIQKTLLEFGLFPFFRQRPFDCVANPKDIPKAIFVSGFDSAPLSPDYPFILKDKTEELAMGFSIIRQLTDGKVYVSLDIERNNEIFKHQKNIEINYFQGPHPAGNISTQIHHIAPINKGEVVWHIEPWHIALIGTLFLHKKLEFTKRISLCGSEVLHPHYLEIDFGMSLKNLFQNNIKHENIRMISGNILTGKRVTSDDFVGFYDKQITVIYEGGERQLLGWMMPGLKKWSFSHTFLAFLTPKKKYAAHSLLQGGKRSLILHDLYEKVFPFDILPAELYKAATIQDTEMMEKLGAYEIVAEDFALCELICPSKIEWQQTINEGLTKLYEES